MRPFIRSRSLYCLALLLATAWAGQGEVSPGEEAFLELSTALSSGGTARAAFVFESPGTTLVGRFSTLESRAGKAWEGSFGFRLAALLVGPLKPAGILAALASPTKATSGDIATFRPVGLVLDPGRSSAFRGLALVPTPRVDGAGGAGRAGPSGGAGAAGGATGGLSLFALVPEKTSAGDTVCTGLAYAVGKGEGLPAWSLALAATMAGGTPSTLAWKPAAKKPDGGSGLSLALSLAMEEGGGGNKSRSAVLAALCLRERAVPGLAFRLEAEAAGAGWSLETAVAAAASSYEALGAGSDDPRAMVRLGASLDGCGGRRVAIALAAERPRRVAMTAGLASLAFDASIGLSSVHAGPLGLGGNLRSRVGPGALSRFDAALELSGGGPASRMAARFRLSRSLKDAGLRAVFGEALRRVDFRLSLDLAPWDPPGARAGPRLGLGLLLSHLPGAAAPPRLDGSGSLVLPLGADGRLSLSWKAGSPLSLAGGEGPAPAPAFSLSFTRRLGGKSLPPEEDEAIVDAEEGEEA